MTADQSKLQHGFRPGRVSTTEVANEDFAQSLRRSDIDEADNVEEPNGEASPQPNAKFTMWDV